jgi:OFA family oxalate/formate antiporter-like MFS transporter
MTIASEEQKPFYGWKALAVVSSMYFVMSGALLYSFPIFLPFLCDAFDWSREFVSWAQTTAMIVIGLTGPFAGIFIAQYGPRRAIVVGNTLSASCFILMGFLSGPWQLFFAYGVLFGLGGSLGGMLPITTIANNWFVRKRSLALSFVFTAGGIGALVLVNLTMKMINHLGWRSTYLMIGAITILLLVIMPGLLVRNKPEDLGQVPDGIDGQDKKVTEARAKNIHSTPVDFTAKEAMRTPALWLLMVFAAAHMFGLQGMLQHQVAFLMDIGLSSSAAAFAMSLFGGVSIVGRLGIGFLGLKYHIRPLAIVTMLLLIAGMSIAVFTETMSMVFVYTTLLGIGMGSSLVAVMNLYPVYFGKTHYPKIFGYMRPFITIISSLGSPLAGRIRDITGSYTLAWEISVGVLIIGLVLLILAKPPIHPTLRNAELAG